ncbi:MAG: hypothetical protein LN416_07070 [Candidatus Thermoplasmatota archaeon]|nr:hypothetical protein [Candidatus Thermoplasmatota archaeon]
MDKKTINLLHWLRFRMLVNGLNDSLSSWLNKAGVVGGTFLLTWFVMFLLPILSRVQPAHGLSPSSEPWGLAFFIILALLLGAEASWNLTVGMHEQDILLVIPTRESSIAKARFMRVLALHPLTTLVVVLAFLGTASVFVKIDFLALLPYAYVSIFLYSLISLAVFWLVVGFLKKHRRVARLTEGVFAIGLMVFVGLFSWALWQGVDFLIGLWNQFYTSQVTRFVFAVPLSATDILLFGDLSVRTPLEILLLLGIGVVFLVMAFRYDYRLYESEVSPYQATMGRGTERESPPLPAWMDKIRMALRVKYQDTGTGSRALFGLVLSQNLALYFPLGLMILFVVFFTGSFFSVSHPMFVLPFLFVMMVASPVGSFLSWVFGGSAGIGSAMSRNPDVFRTVPVKGEKMIQILTLPMLILGAYYFSAVLFVLVTSSTTLAVYFAVASLLPAIFFAIGYVSAVAASFSMTAGGFTWEPPGITKGISILPAVYPFVLPSILFAHSIIVMSFLDTIDLRLIVVPYFVIGSLGILSAYLFYLKGSRDLDSPRPLI